MTRNTYCASDTPALVKVMPWADFGDRHRVFQFRADCRGSSPSSWRGHVGHPPAAKLANNLLLFRCTRALDRTLALFGN
ncbi:hypothetical protein O9K51_05285 [Purpureocillium lavendulum]|uniref:Uncharacterized protein n=1 Tax=Purpureocillium lavendulum TaxID=1247861 RepID=A0AB34FRH8_9HYPO|nr:hypothetical protein O9K51_05285 [Purpureocillium lavendulum]